MIQYLAKQARRMTLISLCLTSFTLLSHASDHADPIFNKDPNSGLAGLFAFPDKEHMVFVLNIYPGLASAPPLKLTPYLYRIHIDTHTKVNFNDPSQKVRYGGSISDPSTLLADITIDFTLNNDTSINDVKISGIADSNAIRTWSGVRDDPFIFPNFFGTNVVSMAVTIPQSVFPSKRNEFIVWGTSHKAKNNKQIDHVGRSNRTMQPRLDFINKVPPSEQQALIQQRHDHPNFIQRFLMNKLKPLLAIRHYDIFPDVMIYSKRFPVGFPNGRKLTDDVADLTCRGGDCLLWELSFADGGWPRQTVNDKTFLNTFPYLAEPWPAKSN